MGNYMYLILAHDLLVKGIKLESGNAHSREVSGYHHLITDFSISNKLITFPTVFYSLITSIINNNIYIF